MKADSQQLAQDIVRALKEVLGEPSAPIHLHEPLFKGREIEYLTDCVESGWVSSVGSYVDRFESMLTDRCDGASVIATVNGTAALHMCIKLAGVEPGDEVLTPSLSFVATANAVDYANAMPHFYDSDSQGIGVDINKMAAYLDNNTHIKQNVCTNKLTGRPIKALIVMHTFGHISQMDALIELASAYHLVVIEDAAEALGSTYFSAQAGYAKPAGSMGALAALSFNGNKIVTAGGGGAIVTSDPLLATRAKHLTTTAKAVGKSSYYHDEVGYNYRLPNINAALAVAQLEVLDDYLLKKRVLAQAYRKAFAEVVGCQFVSEPEHCTSNYWLNTVLLEACNEASRDHILSVAKAHQFECRPVWTPLHCLPMYRDCPKMDLSSVEKLQHQLVNLPSSVFLGKRA